jgi:predicted phage terminase large subunit-like protein
MGDAGDTVLHVVPKASAATTPTSARLSGLRLLDLIPALSPQLTRPEHLAPWCDMIERTISSPVRGLCSEPIRHYKTVTTLHGVVWILLQKPNWRIIVMTHEHKRAEWIGKFLRPLAREAGIGPAKGYDTITDWSNEAGGGVVVMSADQSALGRDCDVLIGDDPVDERGAFDPKVRDTVDDALSHYTARAGSWGRIGSALIVASRWHPDDPIGRRLNRSAVVWEYVHEKALRDDGSAFAPAVMDRDVLEQKRAELREVDPSERLWFAQFQNDPKPDALGLFRRPQGYNVLPSGPFRTVFGVDLAYSTKRGADYFALVVLKIFIESFIETVIEQDGRASYRPTMGQRAYVCAVWREKFDPAQAEQILRLARGQFPNAVTYSYMSGPELGSAHYMADHGIPIEVIPARYSKRTRAQPTIDRVNSGRVLVPEHAPWLTGFCARLILFTGDEADSNDDEADALVSACDGGMSTAAAVPKALGRLRL